MRTHSQRRLLRWAIRSAIAVAISTSEYTDAYDDNLVSGLVHTGREILLGVRYTY